MEELVTIQATHSKQQLLQVAELQRQTVELNTKMLLNEKRHRLDMAHSVNLVGGNWQSACVIVRTVEGYFG